MTQYKPNDVFVDYENFIDDNNLIDPKRLKAVLFNGSCAYCAYFKAPKSVCDSTQCWNDNVIFIETTELITIEP